MASSTVNLTNATLSSNTAAGGNGANALKATPLGFTRPGAAGNGYGGAVYVAGGTVTLTSDSVSSNAAQGGQGGSLFDTNDYNGINNPGGSGFGGGLYAYAGTVYVNSSTLRSNIGQGGSGGGCSGTNGGAAVMDTVVRL